MNSETTFRLDKPSKYLYEYIKKHVDMSDFLERDLGCRLKWGIRGQKASTACPLHNENKPSFHIRLNETSGIWTFKCYGCGKQGSIIDLFKYYYNLGGIEESAVLLFRRFNFKMDENIVLSCLKNVEKKMDMQRKAETMHVVTANLCRMLLRKNFDANSKWVASAYQKLNHALKKQDIKIIEGLGFEASKRMSNKGEGVCR